MNLSTSLLAVHFHKTMTHSASFKVLQTVYYYGCQKKKKKGRKLRKTGKSRELLSLELEPGMNLLFGDLDLFKSV